MRLLHESTIFSGVPATEKANCCFPAIARLLNGGLVVTWRTGSQKDSADGKLLLSRSIDDGQSWSTPAAIPLGPYANAKIEPHYGPISVLKDGSLLAAIMLVDRADPSLPFFHPTTEGLLPTHTLFFQSCDGGRSWTGYREMDYAPYHSPMPITGAVLQLGNGELACPFEVNKNYFDTQPWRHAAAWKISRDGGHSWPECVEIANDPTGRLMYWDARYALGADGLCVATFWTYDRTQQCDARIHMSISRDNGRHWSQPRDIGIEGQVCQAVFVDNGGLVLIYVDRFKTRSIRATFSPDLGRSFRSDIVVYSHAYRPTDIQSNITANYLQDMDTWTFGRVDAVAGTNRKIEIVYYAGTRDATSIRSATLVLSEDTSPECERIGV
jgi:hypothetical protein